MTIFAFLVGNSDMHLKNWALVRDAGRVVLSPAYDLLHVRLLVDDPEEFALPINGKKTASNGATSKPSASTSKSSTSSFVVRSMTCPHA